jgi:acyl carrier protein
MNIRETLIDCIAYIAKIPRKDIDVKLQIYNSGIISSLKLLELMSHIEKQYGIYIKPEELIEDNFSDIGAMTSFIEEKLRDAGVKN